MSFGYYKEILGDGLLIGFMLFMLYNFCRIARYGAVYAIERNAWILGFEIVFSLLILLLGIERLIKDL